MRRPELPWKDFFLAILVAALWGFNFVLIKWGLKNFPPLFFAGLRFVVAALPGILIVKRPQVPWRKFISVGLILGAGQFACLFLAMERGVPAGIASLFLQLQVVFTLLFAVLLLRQRPRPLQWFGVLVTLFGMALIGYDMKLTTDAVGIALMVVAAIFFAYGNILLKQSGAKDMGAFIVWMSLVPPIPLFILSLMVEGPTRISQALEGWTLRGTFALLYIGWISTDVAYGLWATLIRKHTPGIVAPFSVLVPVFGFLSATVILGEAFDGYKLVAAMIVLVGLFLAVTVPRKDPIGQIGKIGRLNG